ncbi:MAG TPA: aminoacyl-tRNA hydrolase [Acidimicrobiales bacterium]|nr:aminoacyl-tRNA hydrolase [Acidimicrobiales bacterium]
MFGARKREGTTGADLVAVGLGNPGPRYARTRHNVGAEAVELLASRHGQVLRQSKELALSTEVRVDGKRLVLAFPQTFMNDSGRSVVRLVRRYGVDDMAKLVIVHDELDLPLGTVRVKAGGGLAGHNGLRSIRDWLRTDEFLRVRIGIGKPPGGREGGVDHVLSVPSRLERRRLAKAAEMAADALAMLLNDGLGAAQNEFNSRQPDDG